jgi:hypothetical protein
VGNDFEGTEFQGRSIVLVVQGAQAGGVEFFVQDAFLSAEVQGGGLLAAGQGGRTDFSVQSALRSAGEGE